MINRRLIQELYDTYSTPPQSPAMPDMPTLYACAGSMHGIREDAESRSITLDSLPEYSLFHSIPLAHIHHIIAFDNWVAIVLRSSIVFLSRTDRRVMIDIKALSDSHPYDLE